MSTKTTPSTSTMMTPKSSGASTSTAVFSTLVYTYTVSSLVSWWLFLVPNTFLSPSVASFKLYSMELAPTTTCVAEAALHNLGLLFAFGFFHSLLARKSVKKWMNLPASVERSLYCLQAAFFLHTIQRGWLEVQGVGVVWDLSKSPQATFCSLVTFWAGAAYLLSATFALDHFHLFGLSQGFGVDINAALGLSPTATATSTTHKEEEGGLATRWHYKHVAHPIMTGMFVTFWATPVMTPSRLVCASFLTVYVLIAVLRYEEPAIRAELGTDYDQYLAKTPRFLPNLPVVTVSMSMMEKDSTTHVASLKIA